MPDAEDMRRFSGHFSKEEWEVLCKDKGFLMTVTVNLLLAAILAEGILARNFRRRA